MTWILDYEWYDYILINLNKYIITAHIFRMLELMRHWYIFSFYYYLLGIWEGSLLKSISNILKVRWKTYILLENSDFKLW